MSSTAYIVDTASEPGRIAEGYQSSWPSTRPVIDAVTVTFVAGYGTAATVPKRIKQAIMMLATDLYENKGEAMPAREVLMANPVIKSLLWSFRVMRTP